MTAFLVDLLRSAPGPAVAIVVVLGLLLLVVIWQLIDLLQQVVFAETETPSRRLRSIIRELRARRR